MENTEMKWYVIRCASGKERKAKKHIEGEIKLQKLENHVSQLLIPSKKENYIRKGKKVSREVNFFPGYLLIQSEFGPDIQHIIKNTEGVISILGEKDKPASLRESEVYAILGKVDDSKNKTEDVHEFILGETVIVTDGPFTNFNGTVEEINKEKKRLKINVKIFGRITPLEIEYTQVMKLP